MICLYLSTEGYDPVSGIIRMSTHSPWSHAGFAEASPDGRWRTLSAMFRGGVKYRPLPSSHLLLTAPDVANAYTWAQSQLGKPYDWTMIAGMVMNRDWHKQDKWFCSELVAAAFERIGSPLFNTEFCHAWITPRDLLLSDRIMGVGTVDTFAGLTISKLGRITRTDECGEVHP